MKILVIGFKKFANHETNSSELILKEIDRDRVKTLLLPVEYEASKKELIKTINEYGPNAILLLALSPYCHRPTLEHYAYNEINSPQADEAGKVIENEVIKPDGLKHINSAYDLVPIQQFVLSQGAKCDISVDPGRFVANQIYYEALTKVPHTIMMHIPAEDDFPLEDTLESVGLVLDYMDY